MVTKDRECRFQRPGTRSLSGHYGVVSFSQKTGGQNLRRDSWFRKILPGSLNLGHETLCDETQAFSVTKTCQHTSLPESLCLGERRTDPLLPSLAPPVYLFPRCEPQSCDTNHGGDSKGPTHWSSSRTL